MTDRLVTTKDELLSAINSEFQSLKGLLDRLSDTQMTSIRDSQGWTVKDHIAHLTDWERSALFFFQGRPRHLAIGVDESLYLREIENELNEVMRVQHQDTPLVEVVANFKDVHEELLRLLETLEDEDFQRPYSHYLPEEPGDSGDRPAINVAYGNTAQHYREHHEWIESLIGDAS
jgi:hypothetical protein